MPGIHDTPVALQVHSWPSKALPRSCIALHALITVRTPRSIRTKPHRKPSRWTAPNASLCCFELPGVWLRADELFVVALSEQLLGRSGAGSILGESMWLLQPRIEKMLGE